MRFFFNRFAHNTSALSTLTRLNHEKLSELIAVAITLTRYPAYQRKIESFGRAGGFNEPALANLLRDGEALEQRILMSGVTWSAINKCIPQPVKELIAKACPPRGKTASYQYLPHDYTKLDSDGYIAKEGYRAKVQRYGLVTFDPDGTGSKDYIVQVRWHTKTVNPLVSNPYPTLVIELLHNDKITHKYLPQPDGGSVWLSIEEYNKIQSFAFSNYPARSALFQLPPREKRESIEDAHELLRRIHIDTQINPDNF